MTPPDVMSAEEARAWRDDGVDGNRDEIARLCDTIVALHERAAGAWLAGAEAARAADVAACDAEAAWCDARATGAESRRCEGDAEEFRAGARTARRLRADLRVAPLPMPHGSPPAPPQSPLPSPDGGTGPQGDGAPAGGLSVAGAYVDAAGVCEQRAQTQDRLAAASPPGERLSRAWAADELRYVADRIRRLAGGP